MLKEFAQYLVSLKDNKTYNIHGDTYSDHDLVRIKPHIDRPANLSVSGLDSIVKLVRNELDMFENRDNGVSQEVEARQGVSLKALVQVKPRVALRPFRTFLEVEQPVSEFLLRLDDDGNVGLFEADGGMWQQTAKASIAAYFEDKLAQEVKDGKIVVMM